MPDTFLKLSNSSVTFSFSSMTFRCVAALFLTHFWTSPMFPPAESSLRVKDVIKEFHPGGRLAQHSFGEVTTQPCSYH